jgi:hypothetical protein
VNRLVLGLKYIPSTLLIVSALQNEKANSSLYLDFALAYKKIGDLDSYRDILEAGVDVPVPHCDVSDVAGIKQFWPITWCCKGVMFLQKFELDGSADS